MSPNQRNVALADDGRFRWRVTWERDGWYRIVNEAVKNDVEVTDITADFMGAEGFTLRSVWGSSPAINLMKLRRNEPNEGRNLWRLRGSRNLPAAMSAYRPGKMSNLRFGPESPSPVFNGELPGSPQNATKTIRWFGNYGSRRLGASGQFVMLTAHRGVYGKLTQDDPPVPENCLLAIRHAAACGFESVELDVKLTMDGELVLHHDYSIGRMMPTGVSTSGDTSLIGLEWEPRQSLGEPDYTNPLAVAGSPNIQEQGDTYRFGVLDSSWDYRIRRNPESDRSSAAHWRYIDDYNPLLSERPVSTLRGLPQWGFDRYAATLAPGTGRTSSFETAVTLREALQYIMDEVPGMVVVLDLRHKEEVAVAMEIISALRPLPDGTDPRDWIILKPFGNAVPGALDSADGVNAVSLVPDSVAAGFASRARAAASFYWIPVVSGRLKIGATPGARSIRYYAATHPDIRANMPIGPDVSVLTTPTSTYLSWWKVFGGPASPWSNRLWQLNVDWPSADNVRGTLAIELAVAPDSITPGWPEADPKTGDDAAGTLGAYKLYRGSYRIPMIGPWRPADICDTGLAGVKVPFTGPFTGASAPSVLGHAWKDDGMGIYKVTKTGYTTLAQKETTCDILTVDLGEKVMATYLKSGNRTADRMVEAIVDRPTNKDLAEAGMVSAYGTFYGLRAVNGRFVSIADGGGAGKPVTVTAPHPDAWERLELIDLDGAPLRSGDQVALLSQKGYALSAVGGGGSTVNASAPHVSDWERFTIVGQNGDDAPIQPGDVVAFLTANVDYALSASGGGGGALDARAFRHIDAWEQFVLTTEESWLSLRTSGGYYLGAAGGGGSGKSMRADARAVGAWETFRIVNFSGGPLRDGCTVALQTSGNFFVTAKGGGGGGLNLDAVSAERFERFTLVNTTTPGGVVNNGDQLAFAIKKGADTYYLRATNGGDSSVNFTTKNAIGPWEKFTYGKLR